MRKIVVGSPGIIIPIAAITTSNEPNKTHNTLTIGFFDSLAIWILSLLSLSFISNCSYEVE